MRIFKEMTVTPATAKRMLGGNTHNRPANRGTIASYAAAMRDGKWGSTSMPIVIASDGRLVDGQHRLMAVVESGASVPFVVVTGADHGEFRWIDRGKKRRGSDDLALSGHSNSVALASCLGWIATYERGGTPLPRGESMCGDAILSLLALWPEATYSTTAFQAARKGSGYMGSSMIAAVHALMTRHASLDVADQFLSDLSSGAGLREDDPVYRLREAMISHATGHMKRDNVILFAMAIKAASARIAGRKMTMLRCLRNEDFPRMEGDND